jgi:N-acetyl-gamma-glutamylphosphate reductase
LERRSTRKQKVGIMKATIRTGIIGGAGYTGGELIRLLLHHPNTELTFVHSKSNAGNKLYQVHEDLIGSTEQMFTDNIHQDIDLLFLCLGHGESSKFLQEHQIDEKIKIIDLANDFRLKEQACIGNSYSTRPPTAGSQRIDQRCLYNRHHRINRCWPVTHCNQSLFMESKQHSSI